MSTTPVLVGRSSSHFTRVARLLAYELGVEHDFSPVYELGSTDVRDRFRVLTVPKRLMELTLDPWA